MVATNLADYEIDETGLSDFTCPNYPYHSIEPKLRTALAAESDAIVEFAKCNPTVLTKPFGYRAFTDAGNPRKPDDWRTRNIFAQKMEELGFGKFEKELEKSFSDCLHQAQRFGWGPTEELREWAMSLALSSAGLFTVHVMNIYKPQRGLFSNILDANLQHDALDRPNYKPAIMAIGKVVRRVLGWKGNPYGQDDYRAEMIIALIESERKSAGKLIKANRGIEFEKLCATLLEREGFDVRETPASGDFGADIIAEQDELTYAIQCKDLNKPVGVKAVQEAIGARRHYTVDFACVCADSGFTDAALELAASNKVIATSSANLARSLANAS